MCISCAARNCHGKNEALLISCHLQPASQCSAEWQKVSERPDPLTHKPREVANKNHASQSMLLWPMNWKTSEATKGSTARIMRSMWDESFDDPFESFEETCWAVLLPGCSVSQKRNSKTDLPVPMPHKKQLGEFSHICEALTILDLFEQKPSLANLPNTKFQNWRTNYDKLHIFVRLLRPKLHVCKFLGKIWLCLNMGYPIISIHSPYNPQ